MDHFELFVNSTILIPEHQIMAVVEVLKQLNNQDRKFVTIYLLSIEQKLYVFDMVNGNVSIKYLYNNLNWMETKARQLLAE